MKECNYDLLVASPTEEALLHFLAWHFFGRPLSNVSKKFYYFIIKWLPNVKTFVFPTK
jgi:hypothetical protein